MINFTVGMAESKQTGYFAKYGVFDDGCAKGVVEALRDRREDAPRMIFCDGHPLDVWRAVDCGFNLFVLQYPVYMAKHGWALDFSFKRDDEISCGLDMRSRVFENDHKPIVEGRDCLCCKNHSRSYLHHYKHVHCGRKF